MHVFPENFYLINLICKIDWLNWYVTNKTWVCVCMRVYLYWICIGAIVKYLSIEHKSPKRGVQSVYYCCASLTYTTHTHASTIHHFGAVIQAQTMLPVFVISGYCFYFFFLCCCWCCVSHWISHFPSYHINTAHFQIECKQRQRKKYASIMTGAAKNRPCLSTDKTENRPICRK